MFKQTKETPKDSSETMLRSGISYVIEAPSA